jgi:hypothetical protein
MGAFDAVKTGKTPCFHVTTTAGHTYGVAATSKRDALQMTQDRLSREYAERESFLSALENYRDAPVKAEFVGTWTAPYGTVLWY